MIVGRSLRAVARSIATSVIALGALAHVAQAGLPCSYDVTIISAGDCPPFGPQATIGRAVNNLGQVAGYYCQCFCGNGDEAFFWDGSNFLTLARPAGFRAARAYGMNDQGWVVGSMTQTNIDLNHAVLWQNGVPVDLGIPPGGNFSEGLAVNSAGQVVGYWGNSVIGPIHGFIWEAGVMTDLGPDLNTNASYATDVSELGLVTGWMGQAPQIDAHAFIVDDGMVTDLGVIPGGYTSDGAAINDFGDVAGRGFVIDPNCSVPAWHAFLSVAGTMTDLGTLPGLLRSRATGLSHARQVVGVFDQFPGCSGRSGFIWQDGVMTDLNDLVADRSVQITAAYGIGVTREIAGTATHNGSTVAVLLSPVGASPADINSDGVVNVIDLIELLLCFGHSASEGCASADTNEDAVVDVLDLIELLLDFGMTCP